MKINELHPWNLKPSEAIALQKELRGKIVLENSFRPEDVHLVAGCDMAIDTKRNEGYAGVIVYQWPELIIVEQQSAVVPLALPYIPGLLSFREIPVLTAAIEKLKSEPDLFFFDGHGIAHPRGMGIASHLGLVLDKPTIGCAKSKLYGIYEEPELERESQSPLYSEDKRVIGTVLRTKQSCRPVFISPGHKIDLATSLVFVLHCLDGFRIPKPTREADAYAGALRRNKTWAPRVMVRFPETKNTCA